MRYRTPTHPQTAITLPTFPTSELTSQRLRYRTPTPQKRSHFHILKQRSLILTSPQQ
ncbi:MAG: hypothetical protein HEQ27_00830 [Dolichospermum sp. JUN01]|nr:hypothetical protein [Dolichospermum sp. JUN01]